MEDPCNKLSVTGTFCPAKRVIPLSSVCWSSTSTFDLIPLFVAQDLNASKSYLHQTKVTQHRRITLLILNNVMFLRVCTHVQLPFRLTTQLEIWRSLPLSWLDHNFCRVRFLSSYFQYICEEHRLHERSFDFQVE